VVSTDGEGYGLSCAPLKDILSPNSQYFRMWPYLEFGSLQI
jgi:hypothetical protein